MAKKAHKKTQVESILERNARVEVDKAWETSKTRRLFIAAATYLIVLYFLITIGLPNPFFNAFIPVIAYLLSTLSLPIFKTLWMKNLREK